MEILHSSFTHPIPLPFPTPYSSHKPNTIPTKSNSKPKSSRLVVFISCSSVRPDPWSLREGNPNKPKPKSKNPKNSLSDDNARRIIKAKAVYLSTLRRNQGSLAQTPKWIKRTPEQMAQYLEDDRHGHLYGKHVVAAIQRVRSLSRKPEGSYNMRQVMSSFVTKLSFREMCIVLKEQRGWRQVRDFFAWMKLQLGYRPSVIAYTIVLRMYGQVGKIKLAEQTFLEMLESGCEPDEVACGTILCSYARWGRHKPMLTFYSAIQQRNIKLPISVFNFMLSSLQKKSLHSDVVDLWTHMVNTQVNPNAFTYTVVIASLVQLGQTDEAFKTLKEMKNDGFVPEEVTYSLLISLSSKMGKGDLALSLYQDMRFNKILPSNYTCASLLTLHYKNRDYSKALALFTEMERYKIAADEVIFSLLIRIYGRLGLYEDAERTFDEIFKLGQLSNEKTYTSMAQVHLNSGNVDKALGVMDQMRSKKIPFSRFALIILLKCYVIKEDLDSAEDTFKTLSLKDCGSCNDMLGLYMKLGLDEKAKDFVMRIRKDGVKFDEELFKKVVKVNCKEGMVRETEELIEEARSKSGNSSSYKLMFESYVKCSKPEEAYLFYREETEKGHNNEMGAVAISILVTNLTNFGKYQEAENVIRDCFRDELELDTVAYNSFIKAMLIAGRLEFATGIYEHMLSSGVSPSIRTFNTMISVYGRSRNLSKAMGLFDIAQTMGVTLDEKAYTNMISYYAHAGQSEDAALLFSKMWEQGIVKESSSWAPHYNTLVSALVKARLVEEAERVYRKVIECGLIPDVGFNRNMMRIYVENGHVQQGLSFFESISSSEQVEADRFIMSWAVHVYRSAGTESKAEAVLNTMNTLGIPFLNNLQISRNRKKD